VVVYECAVRLFAAVFRDEKTRRFGDHTSAESVPCSTSCVCVRETYNMKIIWSKDGAICSIDGILHAQSSLSDCVPKDIPVEYEWHPMSVWGMNKPAATKDPTNQSALNSEVIMGRSFG
jgi:hypothetical protein